MEKGRAFYTAFGHVEEIWRDARFQRMLRNGLLWLTGQMEAPADPFPPPQPSIAADSAGQGIGNAATLSPRAISPGTIFTVYGSHLTAGSESVSVTPQAPRKLGGAAVLLNGSAADLIRLSGTDQCAGANDAQQQRVRRSGRAVRETRHSGRGDFGHGERRRL